MNQTGLAREVLCSKSHILDIERAQVLPTASEVRLMEQALDVDGVLADLFDLVSFGIQESAIVADAEHDAISMTVWEWRICGILQEPEYMRAHDSRRATREAGTGTGHPPKQDAGAGLARHGLVHR